MMHTYRIELVAPGVVFDAISILKVPAKSWAYAMATAKRLCEIRRDGERVLAVRRVSP